ncbi:hypothetical protein [Mycoplasmoides pirum]|uniref:hypothetical protein n=1 Tax=Mycoplasmoides pirum TaxID=2122 RepID=UPI0004893503|nr:hypothetical protein [Mycoplasmoides pirum]
MSRIEKYRAYREKIKNQNSITSILNESTEKVNKFKKSLDNLNPKILSFYKPINIELYDFLLIDSNSNKNTSIIQNFLNDLNFNELMRIREQANLLLLSSKNIGMTSEFEQGWLNHDRGIMKINNCNKLYGEVQQDNLHFDSNSFETFERFISVIDKVKNNSDNLKLKKVEAISLIKNKSFKYKSFSFVIWAVLGIFVVLLITLIIVHSPI